MLGQVHEPLGTRVPVRAIESLADGDDVATVLKSYPQIAREDTKAARKFGTDYGEIHLRLDETWS